MDPLAIDLDGGHIRAARDPGDRAIFVPLDVHVRAASGKRSGERGQGEKPREGSFTVPPSREKESGKRLLPVSVAPADGRRDRVELLEVRRREHEVRRRDVLLAGTSRAASPGSPGRARRARAPRRARPAPESRRGARPRRARRPRCFWLAATASAEKRGSVERKSSSENCVPAWIVPVRNPRPRGENATKDAPFASHQGTHVAEIVARPERELRLHGRDRVDTPDRGRARRPWPRRCRASAPCRRRRGRPWPPRSPRREPADRSGEGSRGRSCRGRAAGARRRRPSRMCSGRPLRRVLVLRRALASDESDLGRDDDPIATARGGERAAHERLVGPVPVGVRRVEVVDARVDRRPEERLGFGLVHGGIVVGPRQPHAAEAVGQTLRPVTPERARLHRRRIYRVGGRSGGRRDAAAGRIARGSSTPSRIRLG